jgi:spore coat polysaccharide biosynthesis protein SpsF (cytidylyltransferase family)
VLERLQQCASVDVVVVATSTDDADDAVAAFAHSVGVRCHRGSAEDVAERMRGAVVTLGLDAFVRVNGDSPLLDPALVDRGVALLEDKECEIATNVFPRSFPAGQSVEVLRTAAFERGCSGMHVADDREHVTPFFYRHADEFTIRNFAAERDYGSLRLVVDTHEDFDRITAIVARMERPHWEYGLDEIAELAR